MNKETLEEAAERLFPIFTRSTPFGSKYPWTPYKEREAFKRGAKWQAERSYSEVFIRLFSHNLMMKINPSYNYNELEELLDEQFKKK